MRPLPSCAALILLAACQRNDAPQAPEPPQARARPNVLLLTLDTLRADVLGCYGHRSQATPRLDALAASGVRMDRAYTVTPLTIPAHSSLFSGMLPPRHGVRDNGDFLLSDEVTTLAEHMKAGGWATMAAVGAEVTSHHWGFAQGFDRFHDDMGESAQDAGGRWRVERPGDAVLADAIPWLEAQAGAAQPWFAWVHLFDPHAPYLPPAPYDTEYAGRPYLGEVAWTDELVGRLVDSLAASGQLENTWVLITGDHGEGLGSHGEQMHGVLLYDATTRVPVIIRPPGGLELPLVLEAPVSLVDLMPTILGAAGLPVPTGLDGVDLGPVIRGEQPPASERQVYVESLYAFRHYGWAPQRALVEQEYKLIDSTTPELYHRKDRAEREDLVDEEPQRLETMRAEVRALVAGLEPAERSAAPVETSPERLAQLEALGYITGVTESDPVEGEVLRDPVEALPSLAEAEKARGLLQAGEIEEAVAALRALLAREPGLVDPRMQLVSALRQLGQAEQALEAALELDALQPSGTSKASVGTLQLELGDAASAAETLAQALETEPYLGRAWEPYLHALLMTAQLERLGREAARGMELLPEHAGIQAMAGVALTQEGDCARAEPLLRAALAQSPALPFANLHLGICLQKQGAVEQAETYLQEELRFFGSLQARYLLVELLAEQRRYAEQVEQLEAIIAAEPPNPLSHHSLAQALFNQQRYDEAARAVTSCRELAPEYPACAMLEANVLKKLGRDEEAQAAYQRAIELGERALGGSGPP